MNVLPSPAKVLLLTSVLQTWTAADRAVCRTERALLERALVGHVYRTLSTDKLLGCVAACEMEPTCYSINYQRDSKACEINRHSVHWFPRDLQSRDKSLYLTMAIRHYDPCSEQQAPCAGKCFSQPGSLETRCICYGRQNHTCDHNISCASHALGMEQGIIRNEQLQASSTHPSRQPWYVRLKHPGGSWAPLTDKTGQWFQVNFAPSVKMFTGVATQGDGGSWWWVTSYVVKYKLVDGQLENYMDTNVTKVFHANTNKDDIVTNSFRSPFVTDTIRLCPKSYRGRIALRMELFGCNIV